MDSEVILDFDSSDKVSSNSLSSDEEFSIPGPSQIEKKLTNEKPQEKPILNLRSSAALDKYKISDRDAVHILVAIIESLSLNPDDFIINRTSIKNARQKFRQ